MVMQCSGSCSLVQGISSLVEVVKGFVVDCSEHKAELIVAKQDL